MSRQLEDLKSRMERSIESLKKCYVGDNTLDKSKMKDDLAFSFCMHYVTEGIKEELITEEEFLIRITGGEEIATPVEKEEQTCPQ